jgi:hypothetical protein
VIVGVIGAGVSRAEDRPEWLGGRVAPGAEGMKTKTFLPVLHLTGVVQVNNPPR